MAGVELGRMLIFIGAVIIFLGLIVMNVDKIPFLGKLPGDIHVERESFTFHFPLTTCILISLILSLIFWLFGRR